MKTLTKYSWFHTFVGFVCLSIIHCFVAFTLKFASSSLMVWGHTVYFVTDNRSTSSFENQHVYILQHFDLLVLSFLSSERKSQYPRVLVCLSFFNIIAEWHLYPAPTSWSVYTAPTTGSLVLGASFVMAQVWKVIADTLQSTAHLLPPPADSALGLVGTVARLTQKVLEGKEVSKENQRYIGQLVSRAVDIASIIKKYVAESRYRDEVFLRFVTSFHTTMEEVSSFVANFAHERWLQRLINGSAVKSQFKDLWRQLDAIAVDFTIHFLRIMDSKGPHERIEHPKLRDFWKHSMTNVHEAKWIHFWDQFLFEFPSAQPFLTGASASANKVKFQEKALPKDANFVGPLEINNLFQPPTALVEEILSSVLAGDEQAVILKYQVKLLFGTSAFESVSNLRSPSIHSSNQNTAPPGLRASNQSN